MQLVSIVVFLAVFSVSPLRPLEKVHPAPNVTPAATSAADAIFSRRALRRARLLIQMRMLQLRDERLECIRRAILRRLPPDLRPTGAPTSGLKQSGVPRAKKLRGALPSESEDCSWVSMPPKRRRPTA
jgi:hypothetical protein